MSKIFDYENQLILRLPEDMAKDLNQRLSQPDGELPNIQLTPEIAIENGFDILKFKSSSNLDCNMISKK